MAVGSSPLHTKPGIHPSFSMSNYPTSIQMLIRRLSDHFYVTRGFHPIEVGNSVYYAALLRPTDETSVYLNTQRELVVIFAHYENFEIRTLEAFDEAYSHVESSRIDDSIRFLVSGDSGIENHIKHYLSSNPEYPIIIPIHSESLSFSGGKPLIESIQRNYVVRDLFGFQAPLRQEYFFFGRHKTVNDVLDLAKSGQNSSLFGLRKSGKTSTIYAIKRKSKSSGINSVIIDCQNPAIHARDYQGLLLYILAEVRKNLGQKQKTFPRNLSLPDFSEAFEREFLQSMNSAGGSVLIIFDEIENISPQTAASEHWRSGSDTIYFWQILRSIYQTQKRQLFSFCIVGTSPKLLETPRINDVDNPVYLFSHKKFIPNLTYDDVSEMLTKLGFFMGLKFPNPTKAKIFDLFGGHPFFTRQLCSIIHQQISLDRPTDVSKAKVDQAHESYGTDLERYLSEILRSLKSLYQEEFGLLADAIAGNDAEFVEIIREAPDLLDHLIGYGLVRRCGADYELSYNALKPALMKAFPEYSKGNENKFAEISKRRNSVEQLIRRNLYAWSRSIEHTVFIKILEKSLTNKRFESLNSMESKYIFSNDTSPLYLSDLISILSNNSVMPDFIKENRSDIKASLNQLNRHRKDAHAKNITSDDLEAVRTAADYLEDVFFLP